jgi:hypothetical protein
MGMRVLLMLTCGQRPLLVVNVITLNFNKIQYLEFRCKNGYNIATQIGYDLKIISNMAETKFLGLIIDNTLTWKQQ